MFVKIALVAVFAAVAGVAQFMQFPASGPSPSQVVGIMASLIVAIGSIFVMLTEEDASSALALAHKANEQAREIENDLEFISSIEADRDRLIELYQALNVMRGLVEQATAVPGVDEEVLVASLLNAAERSLPIALDFAQADLWTIGIYKAYPDEENPGKVILKTIAQRRAINCDISEARVWKEGTGIMGVCYSSGDEIVVPDLQSDGTKAVFGTSANEA